MMCRAGRKRLLHTGWGENIYKFQHICLFKLLSRNYCYVCRVKVTYDEERNLCKLKKFEQESLKTYFCL